MKDDRQVNLHIWRTLSEQFSLVRLKGKDPSKAEGKGWQKYCHEKRAFDKIPFRPGENAGIACGPASGCLVLDVDDLALFESACKRHNWDLPSTRAHETGSGKLHFFFAYPQDGKTYGNLSKKTLGFDTRGDGGQVVAPGSIHPDTGGEYTIAHDVDMASVPQWLLSFYGTDKREFGTIKVQEDGLIARKDIHDEVKSLIRDGAVKGNRSEAIWTVIKALIRAGFSDDQIYWVFYSFKIGAKFMEVRTTRDAWLKKQIDKARTRTKKNAGWKGNNEPSSFNEMASEDSIALAFADAHKGQLLFCHHTGKWFRWDGCRWKKEETKLGFDWARQMCRQMDHSKKRLFSKASVSAGVERFAQADRAFAVTSEIWDCDPWIIGTPGGIVDLHTGALQPSEPGLHITKVTSVAPSTEATAPLWLKFLEETTKGNQDLVRFLQQVAGYSLTGDISEHALFFVYGPGGNGKSVFLSTITNILGDYARTAAMDTFTASKSDRHPTDLAMLRGARLVSATETEEGRAWAESRIKQLTGGDKIAARFMRQDFFEFTPQFKLLIIGNHQPVLKNVDDAARRRFNIIPFVHKPAAPDRRLEEKLKAEYPFILRWMIDGCLDWQRNGLVRPEVVSKATESYFDEQDLFSQWLEECCQTGPREWETTNRLFSSWKAYAERNGEQPGSVKSIVQTLSKRGFMADRATVHGSTQRLVRGLSLKAGNE